MLILTAESGAAALIKIGEDIVDHMEVEVGVQRPDGDVLEFDSLATARLHIMMFGGKLTNRAVYVCTWQLMPESLQPSWVIPE